MAYFEKCLLENDFSIYVTTIEADLQQDVVTDLDDVDTSLKEIRIHCDKCGEYIYLDY